MLPGLPKINPGNMNSVVNADRFRNPAIVRAMNMARQPAVAPLRVNHMGHGMPHVRPRFAPGGMPPPNSAPTPEPQRIGPLTAPVAGRTDHLMISVPEGSYVLPADVVSHIGQNNSQAGHAILDRMFHASTIAKLRNIAKTQGRGIDIAAAGGEFIVPPESVMRLGNGNMKLGHSILDSFVKAIRQKHIETLKKLPGPKKA